MSRTRTTGSEEHQVREVDQKVISVASTLLQALQAGQLDIAAAETMRRAPGCVASSGAKVYWASTSQFVLVLTRTGSLHRRSPTPASARR